MGIWIAILLSETIPVLIYAGIATYLQKSHENEIRSILLLQDSKSINFTYDKNQKEDSQEFFEKIEKIFGDYAPIFLSSMDAICGNIFNHDSSLNQIDVTVRLVEGNAVVLFVDDGELYNIFNNKEFMESQTIKKLKENNCEFEYTNVLGFNKSYVRFDY